MWKFSQRFDTEGALIINKFDHDKLHRVSFSNTILKNILLQVLLATVILSCEMCVVYMQGVLLFILARISIWQWRSCKIMFILPVTKITLRVSQKKRYISFENQHLSKKLKDVDFQRTHDAFSDTPIKIFCYIRYCLSVFMTNCPYCQCNSLWSTNI